MVGLAVAALAVRDVFADRKRRGILIAAAAAVWLWKRGRRHLALSGAEALAHDPRQRIVYLGSLAGEQEISGRRQLELQKLRLRC